MQAATSAAADAFAQFSAKFDSCRKGGGGMDLDFILRANPDYVEALYRQYLRDPHSVGLDWAHFFAGFDYAGNGHGAAAVQRRHAGLADSAQAQLGVLDLIHSYRELGHLIADLNP